MVVVHPGERVGVVAALAGVAEVGRGQPFLSPFMKNTPKPRKTLKRNILQVYFPKLEENLFRKHTHTKLTIVSARDRANITVISLRSRWVQEDFLHGPY